MATTYPSITFKNQLKITVNIYDSFNDDDSQDKSLPNYFGTLTQVGTTVAPNASVIIQPIHGPVSVYIVYDTNNNPVKRVFTMGDNAQTFTITQADVDIITATNNFISLATSSPKDPDVVKFQSIIKDGKATPSQVNTFFQGTTSYKTCTYISYMLVMTTLARTPVKPGQPAPPVQSTTYSLSKLCSYLGVPWPSAP